MRIILSTLLVVFISEARAQLGLDLPVDSSVIDTSTGVTGRLNQVDQSSDGDAGRDQHVERQEEQADSSQNSEYIRPSDAEFNRNWDQESQSINLPDM